MSDLRCHFDSNGWLQGPINITHVTSPNHAFGFGNARGVVMHTEAGYEAGTYSTFMNPNAEVSAFFSIGQNGHVTQYMPVGKGFVAWSQMGGNETWRGIEDEDQTHPSIPLTTMQLTAFAQVFEACSSFDGFPLQVTDSVSGQGLITHGDGGVAWGDHPDCPGNVRKAQRPAIIALAKEIRAENPVPATPPGQWLNAKDWTWKTVTISGTGLNGHIYAFPLDTVLNKFPVSNSATPPGQWLSPSAWTWASVSIAGEGLNGKTYKFAYDKAVNAWVAS